MAIRQYKPVTPGRRQGSVSDFAEITDRKRKPEKSLLLPKKKQGAVIIKGLPARGFVGVVTNKNIELSISNEIMTVL